MQSPAHGVEIVGMIGMQPAEQSSGAAVHVVSGGIDPGYLHRFAAVHEAAGFDTVLIGYRSTSVDGFAVAGYVAATTERLRLLIAHRPGFVAPTLAARKAATLDHLSGGRIALHIISGGSDAEQQRDGDWLDHDSRYRRTDEYLAIVRQVWTSPVPFDHEGEFYRLRQAYSDVKPVQQPYVPLYFGGASGAAVAVGARHCDVYALWGEPVAAIKERIAEVRALAQPYGRQPRFSISLRPILGATEAQAWERARAILRQVQASAPPGAHALQAVGSQRLVDFAAQQEVHDQRLWMPIAAATGGAGNTSALVGTAEQVAESLLAYYDAGVTTLLIRGFDPLQDAVEYGRELIPLVRAAVAQRQQQAVAV
ncbi:MAG: LLM class flavin-dependent oxidoreductase [Candidatus Tectimicrobiota bacterium]